MITKEQVHNAWEYVVNNSSLELKLEKYEGEDFLDTPEEAIAVCYGEKSQIDDQLSFLIHALEKTGFVSSYLETFLKEEALYHPLAEEDFFRKINNTSCRLKKPLKINYKGNFIEGLLVIDDWNMVVLMAETTEEYILFNWETGA
jgi:hypothetical protein